MAVAGQMEKHRSVKQNAHALTNLHDSRAIKQHIEHLVDDDTASPLHARDGEPEADGSSAPGKSASMVWGLLQKGLKKAMGPTRDQLEFTIKIRSMFDGFDQSGDGQLSGNELRKALKGLGVFISKREMVTLMLRFDQNLDGEIDHSEFEDMVKDLIPPPEFDIGKVQVCPEDIPFGIQGPRNWDDSWEAHYLASCGTAVDIQAPWDERASVEATKMFAAWSSANEQWLLSVWPEGSQHHTGRAARITYVDELVAGNKPQERNTQRA